MIETSRKVEMVAAVLYAGAFVLWTSGQNQVDDPDRLRCVICLEFVYLSLMNMSGRAYAALALLLVAVSLTVAAVRLRRSSPHDA